jgi:peptidoglycan/LPS O-acetylase OafA/YrhL
VENSRKLTEVQSQGSRFRLDILGIRGLAILLVLADHFEVPGFDFGFIGVDIFFVVSGYLIVGLMYQEYTKNGRSLGGYGWISISSFFQRRARRILPAAIFVLVVVYLSTLFIDDQNYKLQTKRDTIWALIFTSNINFAQRQTDYFSSVEMPSPLLHYWSLAVEEQFYILMPFLFMAVANWHGFTLAGRRLSAKPRIIFVLAIISAVSFIFMVISFKTSNSANYYSTFLRVWEFGLGALVSLMLPTKSDRSKLNLLLLRRICVVVFSISLLFLNESNFGYLLVIPLVCLAVILYVNNQLKFGFAFEQILTNKVFTFFGKISFSLYLWHWPMLILPSYFFIDINPISKSFIFILLLGISTLSERYVERPFLRIGYMSEFHLSPLIKSRRAMTGILLTLTSGLFLATYQPVVSTYLENIQVTRDKPFWSPPSSTEVAPDAVMPSASPGPSTPVKNLNTPRYMGIFGDSTNQCCSATGAFWPRLVAQHFGMTFADYSKPATTYFLDGVGNNGCARAEDCPSVSGQLEQSSGKSFDLISISSGIGECNLAQKDPDSLQISMSAIMQKFKSQFPNAYIFAVGINQPATSSSGKCVSLVNPIISRAATASGVSFIDDSRWITDPKSQMTRDGNHLNDTGHILFANKVIQTLKKDKL